jgi:hypothetical protein
MRLNDLPGSDIPSLPWSLNIGASSWPVLTSSDIQAISRMCLVISRFSEALSETGRDGDRVRPDSATMQADRRMIAVSRRAEYRLPDRLA